MPKQDPIPPRRYARHTGPGEDDEVPPWANLPSIRPTRPAGPGAPGVPGAPGATPGRPGPPAPSGPASPTYNADLVDLIEDLPFIPDEDAPPRRQQPAGGRARRTLLRKRRRSFVMIGGAVVAIGVVLAVLFLNRGGAQGANISSDLITTFQPGELQQVPNACQVIPAATVQQYLPGKVKQAAPLPIDGKLGSACNWTLDHQPVYRLLELNMLAYAPNGLASGNGSATNAARDAYDTTLQGLQSPPKGAVGGNATVTTLSGLGDGAFSAMQVFRVGGAVSDTATVVIRYHNVIVTVEVSGLEHSNKGHYGPVDKNQLAAAALAFAQTAYASLH